MYAYENAEKKQSDNYNLSKNEAKNNINSPGFSTGDVRIQYNPDKPAQLQAINNMPDGSAFLNSGQRVFSAPEAKASAQGDAGVVQRLLYTDVPSDLDPVKITDLGMWWGMASEWHYQKEVRKVEASAQPRDYIKSLKTVEASPTAGSVHVDDDDEVRMLTHGVNPGSTGSYLVKSDGKDFEADAIVKNIERATSKTAKTTYCFMGDNPSDHKTRTGGSLGKGPVLAPASGIVSFDLSKFDDFVKSAIYEERYTEWNGIIDNNGGWKKVENSSLKSAYTTLTTNKANDEALPNFLATAYSAIKDAYESFVKALIDYNKTLGDGKKVITGTANSMWPAPAPAASPSATTGST